MNDVQNLIDSLHRSHLENAQRVFFAESAGGNSHIVSPFTNFVFEFFLYNSLYSIDWATTRIENRLQYHVLQNMSEDEEVECNQRVTETQMQSAIEKF